MCGVERAKLCLESHVIAEPSSGIDGVACEMTDVDRKLQTLATIRHRHKVELVVHR